MPMYSGGNEREAVAEIKYTRPTHFTTLGCYQLSFPYRQSKEAHARVCRWRISAKRENKRVRSGSVAFERHGAIVLGSFLFFPLELWGSAWSERESDADCWLAGFRFE